MNSPKMITMRHRITGEVHVIKKELLEGFQKLDLHFTVSKKGKRKNFKNDLAKMAKNGTLDAYVESMHIK